MSDNIDDELNQERMGGALDGKLPNSTATLVLGIVSIFGCILWGVPGLICGIIAIVLYVKDKKIYDSNPSLYKASYNNSVAGLVCGIIGAVFSLIMVIYVIFIFFIWGVALTQYGSHM